MSVMKVTIGFEGADCTDSVMSVTNIYIHTTMLLIGLRFTEVESYIFGTSRRVVKGSILDAK